MKHISDPLVTPDGMSIGLAVFVRVLNAMLYSALSMGKNTHSRGYAMRPIVNMPEEDRATEINNMYKKLAK